MNESSNANSQRGRPCRETGLPRTSPLLLSWFRWYGRRYLARHFHTLRISRSGAAPPDAGPLIVFLNHASWWDPLVCLALGQRFFPERESYAAMDAEALEKYRFFRRLGFFPVRRGPHAGRDFLRVAPRVLEQPGAILWLTPQARFADARERPVQLKPGVGILMKQMPSVAAVPLAIEYSFWEERKPEALVRFGKAIHASSAPGLSSAGWTAALSSALERTQTALASEVISRRPEDFQCVLRKSSGVTPLFDAWTRLRFFLSGMKPLAAIHGTK